MLPAAESPRPLLRRSERSLRSVPNVFVKPRAEPGLHELCRGEKTKNEIQRKRAGLRCPRLRPAIDNAISCPSTTPRSIVKLPLRPAARAALRAASIAKQRIRTNLSRLQRSSNLKRAGNRIPGSSYRIVAPARYFSAASCSRIAAILASVSACLARSLATTFSGADCTKRSLESFFITLARNPS